MAIREALIVPLNLPPIIGLTSTGGFQYQLEDLRGGTLENLAATMRGLVAAANGDPALQAVFSTYSTDTPQIYLDIDREKAQTLGIQVGEIFTALQASLGDRKSTRLNYSH